MSSIILGAGITGLAAGLKTGWSIYEENRQPGGLCRSLDRNGYHFGECGGHWVFGNGQTINFLRKRAPGEMYDKIAGIYIDEIYPAPIQRLSQLEDAVNPGTMKSSLRDKFSNELCRLFFYPFNEKYTCGLYDRVADDNGYKSPEPRAEEYNNRFFYPEKGLSWMIDDLASGQKIFYGKKAVEIDMDEHWVLFEDGSKEEYETLVSTIPLTELLRMCGLETCLPDLPYTSVQVLNLGAKRGANCPDAQWLYIPGKQSFFRVGFYSNVNPAFAPKNRVGIYVERAFTHRLIDAGQFHNEAVEYLQNHRWIGEVEETWHRIVPVAYTWVMPKNRREWALRLLKEHDILSIGRFGRWTFMGMAECVEDGLAVV